MDDLPQNISSWYNDNLAQNQKKTFAASNPNSILKNFGNVEFSNLIYVSWNVTIQESISKYIKYIENSGLASSHLCLVDKGT